MWPRGYNSAFLLLGLLALTYVLIAALLMIFEERLIFHPRRYPAGNWNPSAIPFEDVRFTATDGTNLHGWYVPHEQPRAYILYCHGNAGHLADREFLLRILHDHIHATVFIFDYRGYGRSEGRPNEAGVLLDARAARNAFAHQAKITPADMILMGRSLGGAVAVALAASEQPLGLVLESTFTSLPDVAATLYPWLPVRWLLRSQFDSLTGIQSYPGPLLQSHGDRDEIIPFELGRRLHAPVAGPKQWITIPGGTHNSTQSAEYYVALADFLHQLPGSAAPVPTPAQDRLP
ncbi:MAG: alpha/beta hydrolase [Planctomycetaceae bacterium]|nr:alpha/beta hydrolase [Planctomycetaceae bacterium]